MIRDARRAGANDATTATARSTSKLATYVVVSVGVTPKRSRAATRDSASDIAHPSASRASLHCLLLMERGRMLAGGDDEHEAGSSCDAVGLTCITPQGYFWTEKLTD